MFDSEKYLEKFLEKPSLKTGEVAEVLRVKPATVMKWKYLQPAKGPTPIKVGGQYRYDTIEVIKMLKGLK